MDQVKFFKGYVPQISLEALFEYFVSYIDLSPDENYEGSIHQEKRLSDYSTDAKFHEV